MGVCLLTDHEKEQSREGVCSRKAWQGTRAWRLQSLKFMLCRENQDITLQSSHGHFLRPEAIHMPDSPAEDMWEMCHGFSSDSKGNRTSKHYLVVIIFQKYSLLLDLSYRSSRTLNLIFLKQKMNLRKLSFQGMFTVNKSNLCENDSVILYF